MRVVFSSIGIISSVGRDAIESCASIRADIRRPREISYFHVLDEETQQMVPVIGHPVRYLTEGFSTLGRWLRLATASLADLFAQGGLPGKDDISFWSKTALVGVCPEEMTRRFLSNADQEESNLKTVYLGALIRSLALPIPSRNVHITCTGHAGVGLATKLAISLLKDSDIKRVIVLGVDSYLDNLTLEWLSNDGRLKTSSNAIGLSPGEAGACYLLESEVASRERRGNVFAFYDGVGIGKENNHFLSEKTSRGEGLAAAVQDALLVSQKGFPYQGSIISDHNGENWRATELAGARVLLRETIDMGLRTSFPCLSTGETGAASGVMGVCVAVQSLRRRYAVNNRSLVLCSSDDGDVGAVLLSGVI
jgi:3-oxoacyl-[acyl-carrier-protein] synthase-1